MTAEKFLTGGQLWSLIGLGTLYWAAAAMMIRHFPQAYFGSPARQVGTYLTAFPVGFSAMRLAEVLFGIRVEQRLVTASILSACALILDGIAFMWFPELYENPSLSKIKSPLAIRYSRQGAAFLLWGVGISLVVALVSHLT